MPKHGNISLLAAGQALLVRFVYAINGIVLTFFAFEVLQEPRIFVLNLLLLPSIVEVFVTLQYKRQAEWTWFIPSVFIYLLWVVPSIILLEIVALDFRAAIFQQVDQTSCPIIFYDHDECSSTTSFVEGGEMFFYHGKNITVDAFVLRPDSHDLGRRYSMLFQQIMMLIIIFGRWLAPKGKLSRDQLSSLLLALTAMTVDMLEFSTDSLSIEAVACDKVYVGFIIFVWCWSLLQIPMGLTAVKQRKPRVFGRVESRDYLDGAGDGDVDSDNVSDAKKFDCRSYFCCCCESEIWALMVSICMQDGPYLALRLYIIFSAGYFGETLIFFAAKNALIVMLQSYRVYVKVRELWKKRHSDEAAKQDDSDVERRSVGSGNEEKGSKSAYLEGGDATESDDVSSSHNDVEAQLHTDDDHDGGDPEQDKAFTLTEVNSFLNIDINTDTKDMEPELGVTQSESSHINDQTKEGEIQTVGAEKINEDLSQTDDPSVDE